MSITSYPDLIIAYESSILGNRAIYAATALVFFEYLITFEYEIDFLWRRKWSAATWIFVFNRYILLANVLFLVAPSVPQPIRYTDCSCASSPAMNALYFLTAGELQSIPIHIFSILRTFAILQDHSRRLAVTCILIALSSTVIALNSVQVCGSYVGLDAPSAVQLAATIIAVMSGSLVLVTTLLRTAHQVQQAAVLGLKTTLSKVLLRDGSLFFLIVLVQDIVGLVSVLNGSVFSGPVSYVTTPLFDVLLPILLSRFIINLRRIDSPGTSKCTDPCLSRFSTPNFRVSTIDAVIGNLGEQLDFSEDRDHAEDGTTEADVEQQCAACTYWATGAVDAKAAGTLNSRNSSAGTDLLGVYESRNCGSPQLSC